MQDAPRTEKGTFVARGQWTALNAAERRARRAKRQRDKRAANPEAVRAKARARRQANPEAFRKLNSDHRAKNAATYKARDRAKALARYGMTIPEWEVLFEQQGRICRCCGTSTPGGRHKSAWVTDHDHVTGAVRGILCNRCNTTLGLLGDNASGVSTACAVFLAYLGAS